MKKMFFVDFENVCSQGMIGAENLSKKDNVILFYNNTQHKKIIEVLSQYSMNTNIQIVELIQNYKNGLDFQIMNTLGYFVSKYKHKYEYYVVSKDKSMEIGVQTALNLFKIDYPTQEIVIQRVENIKREKSEKIETINKKINKQQIEEIEEFEKENLSFKIETNKMQIIKKQQVLEKELYSIIIDKLQKDSNNNIKIILNDQSKLSKAFCTYNKSNSKKQFFDYIQKEIKINTTQAGIIYKTLNNFINE